MALSKTVPSRSRLIRATTSSPTRSACSSRSLPQNNSPSSRREARRAGIMPEPLRLLRLRPQPRLDRVGLGGGERRPGSTCNPASRSPMTAGVVDAPAFGEFRAEHRAAEVVAPGFLARNVLLRSGERDPRRQQARSAETARAAGTAGINPRTAARGRATCGGPWPGRD